MLSTITEREAVEYLGRQLGNMFPDGRPTPLEDIVRRAFARLKTCFDAVKLPMYRSNGETFFNHVHSDQYATFLYFASNEAWRDGDLATASKLYSLNKALNGMMCMYDTILPDHFIVVHTVGMLLGKATYGDFFVAIHDVTIGTDRGLKPTLGRGVVLYGKASILGNSVVGDDVSVSAGATILNENVPSAHIVVGTSPQLTIKPAKRRLIEEFFNL
ncbi:MAG TPA: hypothetical protein VH062_09275 [Polyangiaceae bacterium]|jgi:serine O-acetyltransferase|nr:hypothetical protein [Polyangiaceae bacterium]